MGYNDRRPGTVPIDQHTASRLVLGLVFIVNASAAFPHTCTSDLFVYDRSGGRLRVLQLSCEIPPFLSRYRLILAVPLTLLFTLPVPFLRFFSSEVWLTALLDNGQIQTRTRVGAGCGPLPWI